MDKIKQTKAEIERLLGENHTGTQEWIDAKECAYMNVLRFIDSLPKECDLFSDPKDCIYYGCCETMGGTMRCEYYNKIAEEDNGNI